NERGVVPLLLKGAAFLLDGTFADPGARMMHDLDILVPRADLDGAIAALVTAGYALVPSPTMDSDHERSLQRATDAGAVDLHFELGEAPLTAVLPTIEALSEASERSLDGVTYRVLAPTHALLHNIVHSEVQDLNHAVG